MPINDQLRQRIADTIAKDRVMLFMKGSPQMPQCGFSAFVVGVLKEVGATYGSYNILADPDAATRCLVEELGRQRRKRPALPVRVPPDASKASPGGEAIGVRALADAVLECCAQQPTSLIKVNIGWPARGTRYNHPLDYLGNDGGGGGFGKAAFGRRDTPSAANGVPTIAVPAGMNDRGQPVNIQFMGRAWDDGRLVGFAYAFEHFATLAGRGHQRQTTAPPLPHDRRKK